MKVSVEKALEKKLTKNVAHLGGLALKFIPTFFVGAPDRLVLMPGGKVTWVELKDEKKKPTPIQTFCHNRLRDLGFEVYVVDSVQALRRYLDEIRPD